MNRSRPFVVGLCSVLVCFLAGAYLLHQGPEKHLAERLPAERPSQPPFLWTIRKEGHPSRFVSVDTAKVPVSLDRARVYYKWFGTYPEFRTSKETGAMRAIHGGIPQRVVWNDSMWARHVESMAFHVNHGYATIGIDTSWTGYVVIDYEAWSPLWSKTSQPYRKASVDYERERDPDAPNDTLRKRAQRNYERAAREFLVRTLAVADSLRPRAQWGYYGYPHPGRIIREQETARVQQINDQLQWLYEASEVIYPSIYILQKSTAQNPERGENTISQNCSYVRNTLAEAFRVADEKPVVPLTWHLYHNTNPVHGQTHLKGQDPELEYLYPLSFPVSAVILWGTGSMKDSAFASFAQDDLRPIIEYARQVDTEEARNQQPFVPSVCSTEQ